MNALLTVDEGIETHDPGTEPLDDLIAGLQGGSGCGQIIGQGDRHPRLRGNASHRLAPPMSLLAQPDIKSCPMLARHACHDWDRTHRRAPDGLDAMLPEQRHQ